ncbi:MAG TPA: NADH-ubiquinone oxidoreductase-F iron-sulfur binding region domain-containing protein [Pseudonocardiaceae bacterium]|jgi:NADH:ubiquinone oxidoreductase subunit F (NADH-binding)|nr:NADH-ubiquinone oxidoreductase-F iron-sulfur binding region domain-containing protein [Pseudonocardiaceae bacterium]
MTTVDAPAHRLLAGWSDTRGPADLAEHVQRYGPIPFADRAALIDLVRSAGLRGRGGAWFPTATKLAAVAAGKRRGVVVANAVESEPGSDKDNALLRLAPHLVLDGIALAVHAVDAQDAVLCVRRGDPVVPGLHAAAAQRGDAVPVRVVEVPARFVASEESALVGFLNTGQARPAGRPPLPVERGVKGRPTLVDNVETLADLALVARFGAEWFRSVGTPSAPGTALVTVGGAVARPGVREIPLGTPLATALGPVAEPVSAVLVGGFGGTWVRLPTDFVLAPDGDPPLGVGVLLALPARACGLAATARIVRYLAGESALQCGPCMFGLPAIAQDLDALATGAPVADRLMHRLGIVRGRGACAHPDGAIRVATSALTMFPDDMYAHAMGHPCAGTRVDPGFPIPPVTPQGVGWR